MEKAKIYFVMTDKEVEENMFVNKDRSPAFYEFISKRFANGYDNIINIDCTKVLVATNITETWFQKIPEILPQFGKNDVAMALLMSGPKSCDDIPNNTVILEEGCLTVKEPCAWSLMFPAAIATAE